jgi:ferric-dicitrate binding protein FerR (iron transport regulator)
MSDRAPETSLRFPSDEEVTGRLLRLAGPRAEVPADIARRVRQSVHEHWQATARTRGLRRQVFAAGTVLAAAAAMLLAVRVLLPRENVVAPTVGPIATVDRIEGRPRRLPAEAVLAERTGIRTGEWVETDRASRVGLRLADGTSLRLDTGSRARLISPAVVELAAGAVYLDTGRDADGFEVRTPLGDAHDIGTQFEVRLGATSLRIRVRSGLVELRRRGGTVPARAGTELTVEGGDVAIRPIAVSGLEWGWTAGIAPGFTIEGRPLAAFLEYLSREHGWALRYADAALARDASSIILHGSVDGLQPEEALAVALKTSGLTYRFHDGELVVSSAPP